MTIGRGTVIVRVALAFLIAALFGAWLGRRITRPLASLAAGAQAFHDGRLDHRIPVKGSDEFARVAAGMNEMADKLAGQIAELREDAQRRRQLLADVAHELRTPVAGVKMMTDALRDGVAMTPERRERALQAMSESADRLQRLVNDLLDLARLDVRELPLHRAPVDLRALAVERLAAVADAARAAGITLAPVEPCDPVIVDADPHRLAQVLDNLLDNAVSHAGAGATVSVAVSPGALTVADTGRGIPAAHLPFIFDPFYRADAARSPGDLHSGLGLRIARGLVEAHGGALALDSAAGKGTRVTVTLPRMTAPPSRR
jgi:signal transduction histidine kinase